MYLWNLWNHVTHVTKPPCDIADSFFEVPWKSNTHTIYIIWISTNYENLCYSPTHSLSYSRKEKKYVVIAGCCMQYGKYFLRKKLPLLHEALCDNYCIVAWSVLNHIIEFVGQICGPFSWFKLVDQICWSFALWN